MSEDQVVAVFSAPAALDAAGTTVPTSLTAQNNKITMTVSHQGGGYAYPILADPTASDAKASRRGTYGISSSKYQLYQKQQWDESQLATGPLRPRVARRNVPWDYALTSQSTDSRAPEGSPHEAGDAHIIDWIQNAHARGLKVVLTLDDERGPRSVGHYPLKSPFWPGSGGQITRGDRSEGRRMALSVSLMRLGITDPGS